MISRDTIAAIATPVGRAAIGVVRISGSALRPLILTLTGCELTARQATLVTLRDGSGEPIDHGIAIHFPAPASYTGDDVLELQAHGGPVVLRRVLQRCLDLGARLAEPGEFTRRAFLNGKLDLLQAESIIDLIDATTSQAARAALRSLEGEFSAAIESLTHDLVEMRALVEATLDFPEEDLDGAERVDARGRLHQVRLNLKRIADAAQRGNLLRDGIQVVIAGQPNVGKSSLLNRLSGEDVAIVTAVPGTTRDAIRQAIDLGGVPTYFTDTAGLRESGDPVERIGVDRAWHAISKADCVLHVVDARQPQDALDLAIVERLPAGAQRVTVLNKIDLTGQPAVVSEVDGQTTVAVSAKTGEGIELLRQTVMRRVGSDRHEEGTFLARERHLRALAVTAAHLKNAQCATAPELLAEELRLAHEALASITGEFSSDDLLGEIFQRFCIGK